MSKAATSSNNTSSPTTRHSKTNNANGGHQLAIDSIYTALLQLMEQKPYNEISITDIVKRAGVSRMAYYRNYQTKDEILTKRLAQELDAFYDRVWHDKEQGSASSTSQLDFLTAFFTEMQKDHILQATIKADLMDQLFKLHHNFMYNIYKYILEIDMEQPANQQRLYYDLGGITGLIMYCRDHDFHADSRQLAQMVLERSK